MIIVGEKINSSLKGVQEAVQGRDAEIIQRLAVSQAANGAHFIDVNCGTLEDEPEGLRWLVETVQKVVDKPCCIDSPNPLALANALKVHKGKPLINSITAEAERYKAVIPLVKEFNAGIIALVQDDEHGMPKDAPTRIEVGKNLIERLVQDGVPYEDIYVDPLIQPISVHGDMALVALETIKGIKDVCPKVHFMCGLSNVSYGLPKRSLINSTFLVICIYAGLDGAILDPENKQMMGMIRAAEALLDRDPRLKSYLKAYRSGLLEF